MLVSNIFNFHPYLGKIPILTNIFPTGLVQPPTSIYMGGSENGGFSPQIIHFNRDKSSINHPFWGSPIFGNTHIVFDIDLLG